MINLNVSYFLIFLFLFVAQTVPPAVRMEQLRSFLADVDNQGSMSSRFGGNFETKN